MKKEDIEFLKELQHELNTQPNDGNASPVFWGVVENVERLLPEGYGDEKVLVDNETTMSLKDFIDTFDMEDEDFPKEIWKDVQKNYIDDVVEFAREYLDMVCEVVNVQEDHEISRHTGAFLTKRACEEYINKFGYNHNHPRTYAMTAYRNFELAHLLDIIQTMNFDEIPVDN